MYNSTTAKVNQLFC